jgi:beta-glucanase (GH16 family)
MIRFLLLICVSVFFQTPLYTQVFLKLTNDTLRFYSYVGGDEFNTSSVNENDWKLHLWPTTNMAQFFAYDPTNTTIENGLAIMALKQKDSVYTINATEVDSNFINKQKITLLDHKYPLKYTAGSIMSKQKYHYGLYELRFKVEKGKGVWPAFWFYGGNKNEEIDIFELKGERNNSIHVDTHCPYGCDRGYKNKLGFKTNWGGWMPISNYLHDGFNVMLLDWRANELTWYINGYPLAYFNGAFPNPMNLFINTQVASQFSAFKPGPDETTTLPNNFYVDYIRIWKSDVNTAYPHLKASSDFGISKKFVSDYKNKPVRRRGVNYSKKKLDAEQGMISLTLSPSNNLIVTVLGELINTLTSLELKGALSSYVVSDFNKENEITIDPRESELTLILKANNKQYSQKIKIER